MNPSSADSKFQSLLCRCLVPLNVRCVLGRSMRGRTALRIGCPTVRSFQMSVGAIGFLSKRVLTWRGQGGRRGHMVVGAREGGHGRQRGWLGLAGFIRGEQATKGALQRGRGYALGSVGHRRWNVLTMTEGVARWMWRRNPSRRAHSGKTPGALTRRFLVVATDLYYHEFYGRSS